MSVKEALLVALETGYEAQMAFVEALPEPYRADLGQPDRWAAKDVLAHITVWTKRMLDDLDRLAGGDAAPEYGPIDHENEGIFLAYRDISWDDLRRLMHETHQREVAAVQARDEAALSDPALSPWQDGRPLWQRFTGNGLIHMMLHLVPRSIEQGQTGQAAALSDRIGAALLNMSDDPAWRGTTIYNMACMDALSGQADDAVRKLNEAFALRPNLREYAPQDSDLASLRERADYQALVGG